MKPTDKKEGILTLARLTEAFGPHPDLFVMNETQKKLYDELIKPFNQKMEQAELAEKAVKKAKKPKPNDKEYPEYIMEKVMGKEVAMYCVRCRAKKVITDAETVFMKNGKPAMKGKCPKCGTGMYKIGSA